MYYRLDTILNTDEKAILSDLAAKHKNDIEGVAELYDQLEVVGYCGSYNKARIHYVAYTLAKYSLDFRINTTCSGN